MVNSNIFKFEQNDDFFFDLYKKNLNEKNYFDCLMYIKKLIEKNGDFKYIYELAKLYTELKQYYLSNKVYFFLLSKEKFRIESYLGLVKNALLDDNIELFSFYIDKYVKLDPKEELLKKDSFFNDFTFLPTGDDEDLDGEFDDDDEFVFSPDMNLDDDYFTFWKKSRFKLVGGTEEIIDYAEVYEDARALIDDENIDGAIKLIQKSKPENDESGGLYNVLSLCYYLKKDIKKGIEISNLVLLKNPEDVIALTSLLLYYDCLKDDENRTRVLNKISALKNLSTQSMYKIVLTLFEVGEFILSIDYLENLNDALPYDGDILMLIAVAYFNSKKFDLSMDYAFKSIALKPNNVVVLEMIRDINTAKSGGEYTPINFDDVFPYEKSVKLYNRAMLLYDNDKEILAALDENCINNIVIKWLFTLKKHKLQLSYVKKLADFKIEKSTDFLLELLLDSNISINLKQHIIEQLLLNGLKKPYYIVMDEKISRISPIYYDMALIPSEKWRTIYFKCLSVFSIFAEEFEYLFYKTFRSLYNKNKDIELNFSENILAAAISYKSNINKNIKNKKNLTRFFSCKLKELNEALKILLT